VSARPRRPPSSPPPHARSPLTRLTLVPGLLLAIPFLVAGSWIVAISTGIAHYDPSKIHVPPWVGVLAGTVFLLPGLLCAYFGVRNGLARPETAPGDPWRDPATIAGTVLLAILGILATWAGFGEGPRELSGDLSPERARLILGILGILCLAVSLGLVCGIVRARRTDRRG